MYWTDPVQNKVYRGNFYGGNQNPEVIISLDYISPEGIAVDWVGSNLYFLENMADRIEVCKLDGSMRGTLIGRGLSSPKALALDPTEGYLFFSDWGNTRDEDNPVRIERAYMDGSNRLDLVTEKLYWPSGISVDIPSKRIYWVDSKLDRLETITYDGQFRQTILYGGSNIPSPHSLAVFESNVYFTDWTKLAVLRTNRFDLTPDLTEMDSSTNIKPNGIRVVHSSLQPTVSNPCGSDNGGCTHLCIVSHRTDNSGLGYQCMCPFGYQLQYDGINCVKLDSFLIVTTPYWIRGIPVDPRNPTDGIDPVIGGAGFRLYDVASDSNGEDIFYTSRGRGGAGRYTGSGSFNITSRKTDGTGLKSLYTDMTSGPGGVAYDWLSKNLYWSDIIRNQISVIRIGDEYDSTNTQAKVVVSLITPRSVAVAPLDGYMFWVDTPDPSKIERAWLDGTNRQIIITAELDSYLTLTVDNPGRQLFWTQSSRLRRIERCDFDGNNRQQLAIQSLGTPFGITVFQNYTYYSDMRDGRIYRVNKITGGQKRPIYQWTSSSTYYGLRLKYYSADLQTGENACNRLDRNGECSHFCFGAPNARTCGCPDGMRLRNDQKNCENDPTYVEEPPCRSWHFQCTEPNTQCIYRYYRCDGENDCLDGSDEIGCGTPELPCSELAIGCNNGTSCVNYQKRCDGTNDCDDGADELNCPPCRNGWFQCPDNGRCINPRLVCDTNNDCGDAADEQNCEGYTCSDDHFSCESIQQCIPLYWVCNGYDNCGDNSDEQDCPTRNCTRNEFTCRSGQCVRSAYQCDGYNDCDDESDEADCPPPGRCNEGTFLCPASGNCLPESWMCDGDEDCIDGSDEPSSCPPITCPAWATFQCATRSRCIPERWLCDLDNDCGDMSDEQGCPNQQLIGAQRTPGNVRGLLNVFLIQQCVMGKRTALVEMMKDHCARVRSVQEFCSIHSLKTCISTNCGNKLAMG
ncbi:low-density lipoprotein receptor-related protein 2-like [Amphiura filiformis]|uniref:low-density lipoprotein receptor-related protein 2-like n=1 Tax=Amphiura filiformis TaxID=82378 RepID=UPI003B213729